MISQVANELWEVKGRKILNLTREDITIVDYKKMLIKNSMSPASRGLTCQLTDKRRFRRAGESQAVQQNRRQGQDINIRDNPVAVHLAFCTPLCLLCGRRRVFHLFRFHHHRLDRFNALVHAFYTKIRRRIRNSRTPIPTTRCEGGIDSVNFKLLQEILVAQNEILRSVCEDHHDPTDVEPTSRSASIIECIAESFSNL